jgi:hypothetical protein
MANGNSVAAMMPVSEVENGYVDTWNIGGDRFAFLARSMFNPLAFLGTTNPATLGLLSVPPTYDQLPAGGVGQNPNMAPMIGAANPWNPRQSIVVPVLIALVISVIGVHYLYFHRRGRRRR